MAILGILAAVVIPNFVGLTARGGKQAYATDVQTIQLATTAFYSETHEGFDNGATPKWGDSNTITSDHYFPCELAPVSAPFLVLDSSVTDTPKNPTNPRLDWEDSSGVFHAATVGNITASCIWMGLLINAPGTFVASGGLTARGNVSVLGNDTGLYLQSMPKSAMATDSYNGALGTVGGTYAWVLGKAGTVFGAYTPDGITWYNGYKGAYP